MAELAAPDRARDLLTRLPAFSPVAVKLLGLAADENASFQEIAKFLSLDPALAGKVLQMANSGMFGRRATIRSILHAIAMLGLRAVSQIAITAAISHGLPRRTTPWVRDWWRHSIATALVAEHVSTSKLQFDFGYTAGLLHAIGQLALFQYAPQEYPKLANAAYADGVDLMEREQAQFGTNHAELAGLMLLEWDLPRDLHETAAKHHVAGDADPLAAAVHMGCRAAEFKGFGQCGCTEDPRDARPDILPATLDEYLDRLPTEVNRIECSLV
jgi:HD-like signal output (HDOD) protein